MLYTTGAQSTVIDLETFNRIQVSQVTETEKIIVVNVIDINLCFR